MIRLLSAACILLSATIPVGCISSEDMPSFDLQGHRGARGERPENTIPAFLHALEVGVNTLELDVVISGDGRVVVSHDPLFNPAICRHPDGRPMTAEEAEQLPLYGLAYREIAEYDCGSTRNPRFPEQKPMPASKPLLADVASAVEQKIGSADAVRWNIETKSTPAGDGRLHPAPTEFSRLLREELVRIGIADVTTVQSFDPRTLQAMRELAPQQKLVLLVGREYDRGLEANLEILGFVPEVYSPDFELVDRALVDAAHARGMLVIPWTVNEVDDMQRLMEEGVDGIITDYPTRGKAWLAGVTR